MTTYTVTIEQQKKMDSSLSTLFEITPQSLFEEFENITVPWTSSEAQSRPGSSNGMYGKKREQLTEYNKNRVGSTLSEEWKGNISESLKGEKNPMYGRKHSEETRQKIREKMRLAKLRKAA